MNQRRARPRPTGPSLTCPSLTCSRLPSRNGRLESRHLHDSGPVGDLNGPCRIWLPRARLGPRHGIRLFRGFRLEEQGTSRRRYRRGLAKHPTSGILGRAPDRAARRAGRRRRPLRRSRTSRAAPPPRASPRGSPSAAPLSPPLAEHHTGASIGHWMLLRAPADHVAVKLGRALVSMVITSYQMTFPRGASMVVTRFC